MGATGSLELSPRRARAPRPPTYGGRRPGPLGSRCKYSLSLGASYSHLSRPRVSRPAAPAPRPLNNNIHKSKTRDCSSDFTRQQCLWEHPRTQTTRHTLQAQELNRVRPRPTSARRNGRVDLYGSSSHTNDLSMSALSRPTSA
eukprot:1256848-Prymnesium_polylepis.2